MAITKPMTTHTARMERIAAAYAARRSIAPKVPAAPAVIQYRSLASSEPTTRIEGAAISFRSLAMEAR